VLKQSATFGVAGIGMREGVLDDLEFQMSTLL